MDILLVEDNSSDAYLFKELFTRNYQKVEIHWVPDGHHALDFVLRRREHAHAKRPDFIVLDLNLPRISGYEVLKELKETPTYADIPIIILTTSKHPLDHSQCKTLGADMCLTKPHILTEYEDLIKRLAGWITLHMNTPIPQGPSVH